MEAKTQDIMTVYGELGLYKDDHRQNGLPDPKRANVRGGFKTFLKLLQELQANGVKPGTTLKITIETVD